MAKRGRKKKSEIEGATKLKLQHEQEKKEIIENLNKLEFRSEVGASLRDLIQILIALDCQASSIRDLFECFGSDIFRAMRTT